MAKHQMRLFYTTTISSVLLEHQHNLYVNVTSDPDPGDAFSTISVVQRTGGSATLLATLTGYLTVLRPCFDAATDITRAELWVAATSDSEDYTYLATEVIGLSGTAGTAAQVAQQATFTFRAVNGNPMRIQLMESYFTGNSKLSFPTSSAVANALAAALTGGTSAFVNKRGSPAIAAINFLCGQNEKLFNERFR